MHSHNLLKRGLQLGAVLIALGSLVAACSSTEETAPPRSVIPSPDGPDGAASSGGLDAAVDPACKGANGCYTCEPKNELDFLNACTDSQCTPFDNAARLPLYMAGKALPPLP